MVYEIYEACGLGFFFSLMVLISFNGIWVQNHAFLKIIGFILYVPAALFVISSFIALKHRGKPTRGWEETIVLINSGIYRIVRHPMYLGTTLFTISFILIAQSIPSTILGIVAIFCFLMASTSKEEDSFNLAKFGDEYREYMKRTLWFTPRLRKGR